MTIWNRAVSSALQLGQGVGSNPQGQPASNTLLLSQTVRVSPLYLRAGNTLVLTQVLRVDGAVRNLSISSHLELQQSLKRVWEVFVYQNLPVTHQAKRTFGGPLTQHLSLSQTAAAQASKGTSSQLLLQQAVVVNIVKIESVAHSLILQSIAGVYVMDPLFIAVPITFPVVPPGDDGHCDR